MRIISIIALLFIFCGVFGFSEQDISILLLGRNDCPGTQKALPVLENFYKEKSTKVSVKYLEVPLPDKKETLPGEWKYSFSRSFDQGRSTADKLNFFYYPTLYIFDKDDELRFEGGCDPQQIRGYCE